MKLLRSKWIWARGEDSLMASPNDRCNPNTRFYALRYRLEIG